jgi:hypothetical protein
MKNSTLKLLFLILIGMLLFFAACKKEVVYPTDQLPANVPTKSTKRSVSTWGEFVIIDAVLWVENKETGVKTKYNHFNSTKSRSSLRWGGSQFDIETIIKDTTTYSFWSPIGNYGKFVLNGDTSRYYSVNYIGSYTSIIEDPTHGQQNLGGSSRPFSGITLDYDKQLVGITIEEMECSINGENCRYFTELTLKKIKSW